MRAETFSKFLGGLPGAGGNPWMGLVYVATLITGAGLVKFMFFSVKRNERGVWLRLGAVTYQRRFWLCGMRGEARILQPGRAAVRLPFMWRLEKVFIGIRTSTTEDIEPVRLNPQTGNRQKWLGRFQVNWMIQPTPDELVQAALRAQDLEQTVMAIVTGALYDCLATHAIGTIEECQTIQDSTVALCQEKLRELGARIETIQIVKLAPVDAEILAGGMKHSHHDPAIKAVVTATK